MIIKSNVWRSLPPSEKFDLLLLHANLNVIGSQVIKGQKNKSYNQQELA